MGPLRLAVCTSVLLGVFISAEAAAQAFPARPVRYIMPLPAGSETDIFARVRASSSQTAGASRSSWTIARRRNHHRTELTAKAPADGHTFLHAITAFGINATLHSKLPYDTLKDFSCASRSATFTEFCSRIPHSR